MGTIGFPIVTIFNQSGTYTSSQNVNGVACPDVHYLMVGASVGSGSITISIGALAPDGNYYQIFRQTGITGEQTFTIPGPPIPNTLNVSWGPDGASATTTIWLIGQA
jgi:hypothetical protein